MEKMINHFSHRHPLMLRSSFQPPAPSRVSLLSLLRPKPDKHCSACQKCYEGPAYCCDDCSYYLHESCAGLPFEIQHFYHSSHSLTLHGIEYDTAVNCDMCQESWMGFTYRCSHCDFKMDIQCAKLQPVIQLSIHPDHPLTLQVGDTEIKSNFFCDFCNNRCDSNWTFCCKDCNFKIDFDCARMLLNYSKQVQHFSHEHCLTLAIVYRNSDVYSPVCCFLCDKPCNGPTYVCFLCKFNLHKLCLESLQTIIQNPFHKHPLIKFEKKVDDSTSCSACGEPCLDTTFACLKCKCLFHELCIQLPQEIQHFFHPCPLILRQETTEFTCKGCEKSRTQFAYHCNRCHFYLDVQCALMFTENFEGQKCIKNSSHRHPLILCNKERNGHVNCNGCLQVIFGEIYGCVQCNFYLHKSCAAAPQQIKHPFHPNHTLTLRYGENLWCTVSILKSLDERGKVKYLRHKHLSKSYHPETEVCCGVCEKSISGPSYNCISCKFFIHQDCLGPVEKVHHPFHPHDHVLTLPKVKFRCNACCVKTHNRLPFFFYGCDVRDCNFKLDIQCSSLNPSINYKGHRHQVTFFKKVYDDPECEVCKFRYNDPPSYLRCVECDDFNVHLLCAALPSTINHKCHIDPLYLEDYFADDDSSDDDSGEYYCDACEESRDKRECVYRCAGCSNYVAHINCVLDEVLLSISGKRGEVEFRNVDRDMADKRGLTLAHIFNPSNEDEQKEFKVVEVAISDLIRERMSKAEVKENDDVLEDLECSDETFILFLKNVTFDDDKDKIEECSGITFWDLDSKVVKFRDYRVSQNFVPILEKLFIKYGDISEKSPLNLGTKTRFLNIFCGVVRSMCNTKAKDVNRTLLFNWWKNFKLVQEAKFDIQFAFDHLYRFAQSLIRILFEYKIDNTTFDNQRKIDDLTTELDGLKVKQEEHIRSKKGKSKLEKDILVEDFELLSKMVWTDFL